MKRMAKILSIVMALTMMASLFAAVPTFAATQLANGDFSAGLEGWSGTEDKATAVTENDNTYMEISAKSNIRSLMVEVEAGKAYAWSFDILSEQESRVYIRWYNADGEYLTDTHSIYAWIPAASAWKQASIVGTAPKGVAVSGMDAPQDAAFMVIEFNKFTADTAKVSVDNVKHIALEEQTGELLTNGNLDGTTISTNIDSTKAEVVSGAEARDGEGKALKLTNTEADTKTVSAYCFAAAGQNVDVSVYMNLTALDEDTASGVLLEVFDGTNYKRATSTFKVTGLGWRKMMIPVYSLSKAAQLEIRVTFKGVGTVVLDDFSAIVTDAVFRNGDMEGLTADYTPADWASNQTFVKYSEDEACTAYTNVENGNTYAGFKTNATSFINHQVSLKANVRYKLQFDYRAAVSTHGAMFYILGFKGAYVFLNATTGTEWATQTYYFTVPETKDYTCYFGARWNGVVAHFDNISLTVVDEPDTLVIYDKNNTPAKTLEGGETYTVKYTGFGTDYENAEKNRKVQLAVARYDKSGKEKMMDFLYIDTKSATKIEVVSNETITSPAAGEVPLVMEYAFTVPENGNYSYKAFAWDADAPLVPLAEAAALE